MYPYYQGYIPDLQLTSDDIWGIQALYGANTDPVTEDTSRRPPATPPSNAPDFCETGAVDAFVSVEINNHLFSIVFQGRFMAYVNNNGILEGYPKPVSDEFREVEGDITAAFYSRGYSGRQLRWNPESGSYYYIDVDYSSITVLFTSRKQYYIYKGKTIQRGFPRWTLRLGINSIVDAAGVWMGDGYIYLMTRSTISPT